MDMSVLTPSTSAGMLSGGRHSLSHTLKQSEDSGGGGHQNAFHLAKPKLYVLNINLHPPP